MTRIRKISVEKGQRVVLPVDQRLAVLAVQELLRVAAVVQKAAVVRLPRSHPQWNNLAEA